MGSVGPAADGVISIRPSRLSDHADLVAGRDALARRFLGEGSPTLTPTACIIAANATVGWVDFDVDRDWLLPGEVNLGYNVFPSYRHRGYGTRAVKLLLHRLALDTNFTTATLLIDPDNIRSLELAERAGFERGPDLDGQTHWKRPLPPISYTDGVVTLRPPRRSDLDMDLSAKDERQIRWLWLPGERELWEAMGADQQRAHARHGLDARVATFGAGPKWTFSVDAEAASYVAYLDCDLANEHVPTGEANISYSAHPAYRGRGYVSRAVRLVHQFLRDNTGAREAHIITDVDNHASRRVADAVGATVAESWVDELDRTMVRHISTIDRTRGATALPGSQRYATAAPKHRGGRGIDRYA